MALSWLQTEKGRDIMKRLDMSIILSVCFLIILFIAGCPKVQQPELEDAEAYNNRGIAC
jgi:hypothetical protein